MTNNKLTKQEEPKSVREFALEFIKTTRLPNGIDRDHLIELNEKMMQ